MGVHGTTVLPSGAVVHSWAPTSATRATVVVQHGYGEYAERFVEEHARLVPYLVDQGFAVRALDLWGHGRSPGRRGAVHVGRAVRDHLAVRALAATDDRPVFLVGHSLGGLVSASSAATDPTGLAGVVLLAPALPDAVPRLVRRALGAAAALRPQAPLPRPARPADELSRDPGVGARVLRDPGMVSGQISLLVAATALDVMADLRVRARNWRCPALVVHGTADTYTDPRGSGDLVGLMADADVQFTAVPDARHELLNDHCSHDVLGMLTEWLRARV